MCTARASRVSGVRIGQSSSSAAVNASLSASSSSRFARSCSHAWRSSRVSQPRPIRAIARSVSTYVTISAEHRAGLVVRQPACARLLPGPLRGLGVDPHCDVRQFDRQRILRQPLPIGDRRREHVQDLERALEPRGLRVVLGGDVQAGHEVAGGHEHHVGLAQRRQHAADVVQERRVGPDHEHAVAFRSARAGCRAGTRRGAAPPPSSRCPGRPRSPARRDGRAG